MDGLNFKLAVKQDQPAFILRHLKIGLKLTSALVSLESIVAEKFAVSIN